MLDITREKRPPREGEGVLLGSNANALMKGTAARKLTAKLTVFKADQPIGKRLQLNGQGEVSAPPPQFPSRGSYEVRTVGSLAELKRLRESLTKREALAFGVPKTDAGRGPLVSRDRRAKGAAPAGAVCRTREEFQWPKGPGVMLLDYDPPKDGEPLTGPALVERLRGAVPGLGAVDLLVCPSAGGAIYDRSNGRQLRPVRGWHVYALVPNAEEIPEFGRRLEARLWLAGEGRAEVVGAGRVVLRTLVDGAVWKPEGLDFVRATCGRGLEQRLPAAEILRAVDSLGLDEEGSTDWLGNEHLPALSPDEERRCQEMCKAAREAHEVQRRAREARDAWARKQARRELGPDVSAEEIERRARECRENLEAEELPPALVLHFSDGSEATAAEVMSNPDRYHGRELADPLEPEYRGDGRIAIAHLDNEHDPHIWSHAHGGVKHSLRLAQATATRELDALGEDRPAGERLFKPLGEFLQRPPPSWLIRNVLPSGALALVYGEPGAGKSFLALDIGAAIARGEPWCGRPVRGGRVFYVAAEGGGGLVLRLKAYLGRHGLSADTLPLLIADEAMNLRTDDDAAAVAAEIEGHGGAALLVIDTLAAASPGANENSSEDMGAILGRCRRLRERTGSALLLVHHAGKDATRGARGWSGVKAAVDTEIEVTRDGDLRFARVSKQRDGEDGERFPFRLAKVPAGLGDEGEEITSAVVEHEGADDAGPRVKPQGKWQERVIAALENPDFDTDESGAVPRDSVIAAAVDMEGAPQSGEDRRREYASRALSQLAKRGALELRGTQVYLVD